MTRTLGMILAISLAAGRAEAQQRPLVTEDPETIGSGLILLEGGLDYTREHFFPVSGLQGNLLRLPVLGASIGISSIAEVQIDGALYQRLAVQSRLGGPLAGILDFSGDSTSDIDDIVVATKVRFVAEKPGRPAMGVRFATKLPNASNESGLGLDTTDFHALVLVGKTIESVRVVGNVGLGILGDPTRGDRQNDVLLYGLSVARALARGFEVVGEVNGRADMREGEPPPGTDSRAMMRLGARLTRGTVRVDGGFLVGMTSRDPSFGFTAGATYVFRGFRAP